MANLVRIFLRCFATVSVIVGPLIGLLAIGLALRTSAFVRHALHADGSITELKSYKDSEDVETFAPTFTFRTASGQTITKESSTRNEPPAFTVGQHVPVLFDPDDAQHAEIATTGQLWFIPILLTAFSLAFTTAGILLFRTPQIKTALISFLNTSNNA